MIAAARLGDHGYVLFLAALQDYGVIDQDEKCELLRLHGLVLRLSQPPLDDGVRFDEDALADIAAELEADA